MAARGFTEIGGVQFKLPAKWEAVLAEDEDGAAAELQSPGVTFGIVGSYDPAIAPETLVDQALTLLGEEHDSLETEKIKEKTWKAGGVGVEACFMSLDMVSYAWLRSWRVGEADDARTVFVFLQGIEPELDLGRTAFKSICKSLEAA